MKKIAIITEVSASPLGRRAVGLLSELLLDYTYEYPICVASEAEADISEYLRIYVDIGKNSRLLSENGLKLPEKDEAYVISVRDGNVFIIGSDEHGLLYGCMDFYNKYIMGLEFPNDERYRINPFENTMPDFEYSSYPSVKNRGIWTWGHVIYNYRGFIDNMLKLKMNTLIVWNDTVPVNAREMVDYAHSCGIKVIWGYSWCWGIDCAKVFENASSEASRAIFEQYEKEYSSLGGDGIYFQSFTELEFQKIGDKLIAEAVTDFVNETAALFFEKYPDIELQFGLHATSVNENLQYIKNVDSRIRIVWENCGSFPFSYIPSDTEKFAQTLDFVREIALLRGETDKFGAVTKGLTKLDWSCFEHLKGAAYIGTSSKAVQRNRIERKRKIWKYLQSLWLTEADKAYEAVRVMAELKKGDLYITPLVEDGMFEENIVYPVALFAEMLWDCNAELKKLINETALKDYVDFA